MRRKLFKFLSLIPLSLITASSITSCSVSSNQFYMANFENYISDDLKDILSNTYDNFNYRTFATNEDLERNFSRNYDIAIPSTYLVAKMANEGKLEPIDWSKFNLYKLDNQGFRTNQKIMNAADALSLFTEKVVNILTNVYWLKDFTPEQGGLLNYMVPYFLQDFIFAYKNSEKLPISDSKYWEKIIEYAGKNTGKDKAFNRIALIDDYRSIYSIPRLIQTQKNSSNNSSNNSSPTIPTINPGNANNITNTPVKPENNKTFSIQEFETTYKYLSDPFEGQKNSFLLNTDSNTILNNFADPKGSDAAILYNGDALYAFQGGDNYSLENTFEKWLKANFNNDQFKLKIVRTNDTLMALDGIVINKNSKHKEMAYEIIKKVTLEGADMHLYANQQQTEYAENNIFDMDENDPELYKRGPMLNFSYVQYTSPLKSINEYVLNSVDKFDTIGGFFTDSYSYLLDDKVLNKTQYKNYVKLLTSVYRIEREGTINNMIEQNLTDINKSNMSNAFKNIKRRL